MTASTTDLATSTVPAIGTVLGPLIKDTGLENWNRFAAVNDEFVPIHMDDEAGRAVGMPGAFGPGNLLISYLHALVRDWMDGRGTLVRLSAEFRKPNTKGPISIGGSVVDVVQNDKGSTATLDLWIRNESDALLAPGRATVRFDTR